MPSLPQRRSRRLALSTVSTLFEILIRAWCALTYRDEFQLFLRFYGLGNRTPRHKGEDHIPVSTLLEILQVDREEVGVPRRVIVSTLLEILQIQGFVDLNDNEFAEPNEVDKKQK
jgi:hypothetical protein